MSLNGLDAPAIQEAYQSAIVEIGGWFILKYSSRDSVELLGRGKAGVNEARAVIHKYEDASPLYGLIIYRRRKILIKYIPEGTSRLLQARTAVHFQDISERFAPYETLLEITTADELNDTSLASSFPLHTASPSASSHRLHEISEDGEDTGAAARRPAIQHASTGPMFGTQRYKAEKRVDQIMRNDRPTPSIHITSDSSATLPSSISSALSSPQKTSISQFLVREDSGQRSITSLGSQHSLGSITDYAGSDVSGKSADSQLSTVETTRLQPPNSTQTFVTRQEQQANSSSHPGAPEKASTRSSYTSERLISASAERQVGRTSLSNEPSNSEPRKYDDDPYDFSRFEVKPKVKLGPRPIAVSELTKRPSMASTAALPASYRSAPKKQEPVRPKSQSPTTARMTNPLAFPAPPPIPVVPEYNPRPLSRGSVKSLPSHKSTGMTNDKIRLMKAVELRKKQLRKSNPQPAFTPPASEAVPKVPVVPEEHTDAVERSAQPGSGTDGNAHDEQTPSNKADSGIEMGYEQHKKQEEDKTAKDRSSETSKEEASAHVPEPDNSAVPVEHAPEHSQSSQEPIKKEATLAETQAPALEEPTISLDMLDDTPTPLVSHQIPPAFGMSTLGQEMDKDSSELTPSQVSKPTEDISSTSQDEASSDRLQIAQDRNAAEEELEKGVEDDPAEPPQSPRLHHKDLAKRRRGFVEPLHIEAHADGEFLSDDEFLEELHSATFQEAKPITMARSPMAPTFARRPSANSTYSDSVKSIQITQRSPSTGLDNYSESPQRPSPDFSHPPYGRSMSSSTNVSSERGDQGLGIKRNASPGIARRFQTLAEASYREPTPSAVVPPAMSQPSTSTLWRDRKTSVRGPPRSMRGSTNSIPKQSGSFSRHTATGQQSGQESETAPVWNVQHDPSSNRESVSVTARIVRPSLDATGSDDYSQTSGSLQQSQLVINHKRASASPANLNKDLPPINTATSTGVPSSPTQSPVMTRASTEFRTLHSNRKSFGRLRQQPTTPLSPNLEDFPPPPGMTASTTSASSNDENSGSREGSRTSRFFKRMSNLGGNNKRRSGAQQANFGNSASASQGDAASLRGRNASLGPSDKSDMPPAVVVGDLNVQFPDSLLWKRRIVEIDEAGYLIFSLDIHKSAAKTFHLSEFRIPYTPDLDSQELPNSVRLDFIDGTTLQAACEDGMTHRQVLHVLRTYWKAWAGTA